MSSNSTQSTDDPTAAFVMNSQVDLTLLPGSLDFGDEQASPSLREGSLASFHSEENEEPEDDMNIDDPNLFRHDQEVRPGDLIQRIPDDLVRVFHLSPDDLNEVAECVLNAGTHANLPIAVIEVALERVVATGALHLLDIDPMLAIGSGVVNTLSLVYQLLGGQNGIPVALDHFVAFEIVVKRPGGEQFMLERALHRGGVDDPPPQYAREQVARHFQIVGDPVMPVEPGPLYRIEVESKSTTHFQIGILVSFALLRAFACGAAFGVVLAIIKFLSHAHCPGGIPNGPIGSMIINVLLQGLNLVTAAWALYLVGLGRMGSIVAALTFTDVFNIVTSFLLACVVYLMAKERRAQARPRELGA